MKICTALLVAGSLDVNDWHYSPANSILTFALILFLTSVPQKRAVLVVCALVGVFLVTTFLSAKLKEPRHSFLNGKVFNCAEVVPPGSIVSIYPYLAKSCMQTRFSFYPRGVSMSPKGIADYILLPRFAAINENLMTNADWVLIQEERGIVLLKRANLKKEDELERNAFMSLLGSDGGGKFD